MKKIIIVLIIVILIVLSGVGFMFWKGSKKKSTLDNNIVDEKVYYGNRGNISQSEKIKFLSKNDEYLVGMMGLPVSIEATEFSNETMLRFALNIAVYRYGNVLESKTLRDGSSKYLITESVVNSISQEFFGIPEIDFDKKTNEYYSAIYKGFLFDGNIEKIMYFYPVSIEKNEENGFKTIIADSIFVSDDQNEIDFDESRYEGKYNEENVDSTVKLIFNSENKLISYQYQ